MDGLLRNGRTRSDLLTNHKRKYEIEQIWVQMQCKLEKCIGNFEVILADTRNDFADIPKQHPIQGQISQ
jgi:hypothetical protein